MKQSISQPLSPFLKGDGRDFDFVPMDQPAFKTAAKKAKVRLIGPKTAFLYSG